jgi:hypothetical protein
MRKTLTILCFTAIAAGSQLMAANHSPGEVGALPILLGTDKVRSELKITSLQRAVLDSLRDEYKNSVRAITKTMPTTPEQRAAADAKLAQTTKTFNKRAIGALSPAQRTKLAQVEKKFLGTSLLFTSSAQKAIGITPQQSQQIAKIEANSLAYVGKINARFESGKIDYAERLSLLRSNRLKQGEQLLQLLTPEQKDAFSALSTNG